MPEDFTNWIGKCEARTDYLDPVRTNALWTASGESGAWDVGDPLPPLYHWLYFWDVRGPDGLGEDGHPARGGFLPPVPLPRRMWAGGRLEFHAPLRLGDTVTRRSTIRDIRSKSGSSGDLVFVTVEHLLENAAGAAIREEQDIVYLAPPPARPEMGTPQGEAQPAAVWHKTIMPDTVLLFRYSALTLNGHRIHYDRSYAMEQENYPALVVQGPLQATLLAGLAAQQMQRPVKTFNFRGQAPAFDSLPLHICGDPDGAGANLWAEQAGKRTMVASAS